MSEILELMTKNAAIKKYFSKQLWTHLKQIKNEASEKK